MIYGGRPAAALLFLGDIVIFALSLWLTLLIRYFDIPSEIVLSSHLRPFAILFLVWTLVFYMAGLYGKRMILFKKELPGIILRTQITNIILAALFFFTVPGIGIAPKTNLLLYLLISLIFILIWRLGVFPNLTRPASREKALIIGSGPEVEELVTEVNQNVRYHLEFVSVIPAEDTKDVLPTLRTRLQAEGVSMVVIDTEHESIRPFIPEIYEITYGHCGSQAHDLHEVYEQVFDRVPLSLVQNDWFMKNISETDSGLSRAAKRAVDIVGAMIIALATVLLIPILFVLMRIEGPGPLLISQIRFGRYGKRIKVYKFRSMQRNDSASKQWVGETSENKVTRVGSFLRLTSLDEFPQFWNILKGELSLIGPRSDIEGLGERLKEEIPYYSLRYIVKPGITGWAQINQQYEQGNISPQSIAETKVRLAYDFYYIKNQSLGLDLVIALKTLKRMFFRISSW